MYCVNCGAKNAPEATFCQQCGKPLRTALQDAPTVSTNPSALSSPYEYTPYATTPSTSADTAFAPPPPPGVPASVLPTAPRAPRPKRRRGYFIALALIVLLVLVAVDA